LRTARAFHVRIICVNLTAVYTLENAVRAGRRSKTSSPHLGIYCQPREARKQRNHISQYKDVRAHDQRPLAGALVAGGGTVSQRKTSLPRAMFPASAAMPVVVFLCKGSNRRDFAKVNAFASASSWAAL